MSNPLNSGAVTPTEFDQSAMLHTLPKARIVHRLDYLTEAAKGARVIHVGFSSSSFAAVSAG